MHNVTEDVIPVGDMAKHWPLLPATSGIGFNRHAYDALALPVDR